MSRKKHSATPQVVIRKVTDSQPGGELNITDMDRQQAKHLRHLEHMAVTLPRFNGVPVAQALTYELIQVLNDLFLREALSEKGDS